MKVQEIQDGLMVEENFGVHVVVILSLVEHHN
jgi:hypothetical protein